DEVRIGLRVKRVSAAMKIQDRHAGFLIRGNKILIRKPAAAELLPYDGSSADGCQFRGINHHRVKITSSFRYISDPEGGECLPLRQFGGHFYEPVPRGQAWTL